MSIYFEVDITGTMIGYKLSTDPEEAAYALRQMAHEVADYFQANGEQTAAFLRKLADEIEFVGQG